MMIIPLVTCSGLGNELEARPFEFPDEVLPVIPMLKILWMFAKSWVISYIYNRW
jgi:hypothetical protein